MYIYIVFCFVKYLNAQNQSLMVDTWLKLEDLLRRKVCSIRETGQTLRHPAHSATSARHWAAQVMSRQEEDPETRLVAQGPRDSHIKSAMLNKVSLPRFRNQC